MASSRAPRSWSADPSITCGTQMSGAFSAASSHRRTGSDHTSLRSTVSPPSTVSQAASENRSSSRLRGVRVSKNAHT